MIFCCPFYRITKRENIFLESLSSDFEELRLMRKLKMLLLSLKGVVDDAEEKGLADVFVSAWLESLKNIVHEADQILDEMEFESNWFNDVISSLNPNGIRSRMFKMVDQLEQLVQQKDLFCLANMVDELPSLSVPTTSLIDESEVYGRDVDKEKILEEFLLQDSLNKEKGIPIAVIVGVPGIGKSTLAQILFNDERVKDYFDVTSWVYISHGQDVLEITKKIYECVTVSHCVITDLNLLQVKLKEILHKKRFLIVLDDIWNIEFLAWDILQIPFRAGDCRSRLIMTSCHSSVTSAVRASLTHHIPYLSFEDSCLLFDRYASTSKIPCLNMRERIVKNCFGLPLAIKVVAEYLSSIDDIEIWDQISTVNIWDIPSLSMKSLIISYARLSSYMKSCFTYCSIFPNQFKIQRWQLIRLWRAKGLLPCSNAESIEELGNECIKKLVSISFMTEEDEGSILLISDDIVYGFARKMAGKFHYTQMEFHPLNVSRENIRYLSFRAVDYKTLGDFDWLKQLRIMMDFSNSGLVSEAEEKEACQLLSKLKRVRTLSLKKTGVV